MARRDKGHTPEDDFHSAEAVAIQQMKVLLQFVIKVDSSLEEGVLFYDEKESCTSFLDDPSPELSTDVVVLASFAQAARTRYQQWLNAIPQPETDGEAPSGVQRKITKMDSWTGARKLKKIDILLDEALLAIDACLDLCRATADGSESNASLAEDNAVMRMYFLMKEVLFQDRACHNELMTEEEREKAENLLGRLQADTMKLSAAALVDSAISDVVIARYEDWVRRSGQTEPDTWVDRIDTAIDKVSGSTDALFAIGRGYLAEKPGAPDGIAAYWTQAIVSDVGYMPKARGQGASAGRGKAVKVVKVPIPVDPQGINEEVLDESDNAQESKTPDERPKESKRALKIAVRVAVSISVLAVPVVLSLCFGRPATKKPTK